MKKAIWIILLVFILLKIPTLNTPFIEDELSLVYNSFVAIQNPVGIIRWSLGGHPPLIMGILMFAIRFFPYSLMLPHIISLIFALIALFFFYKIIEFYSKKDALPFTILLALTPLFFARAGILNLDLPLCTFLLMSYYFYIKNRRFYFVLFSSLATLTKEPALVTYSILVLHDFLKNKKNIFRYLKENFYLAIPYLLWLNWITLLEVVNNWLIYPDRFFFLRFRWDALLFAFIEKGRFLLLPGLIAPLIKREKHAFLLVSIILLNTLLFLFFFLPRYMIIVIPFIYILFSLWKSRLKYVSIAILIALSPFLIFPNSPHITYAGEDSMDYLHIVALHKSGFAYLNNHYNGTDVFGLWPHSLQGKTKLFGYTNRPYKVFPEFKYEPYAYSSSLNNLIKSNKFEKEIKNHYQLVFSNYSNGNWVKIYKLK